MLISAQVQRGKIWKPVLGTEEGNIPILQRGKPRLQLGTKNPLLLHRPTRFPHFLFCVRLASGWGQCPPQSEEPGGGWARERPTVLLVSAHSLQLLLSTHPGPGQGDLGR